METETNQIVAALLKSKLYTLYSGWNELLPNHSTWGFLK